MSHTQAKIKRVSTGAIAQALTNAYINPGLTLTIATSGTTGGVGSPSKPANAVFPIRVSAVYLNVTNIIGAASLSFRACEDAALNFVFIPETTAPITAGLTTATSGTVTIKVECDFVLDTQNVYITARTNAGTCTLVSADIVYETQLY